MAKTILIVEDDPNIAELVQMYLEKEGYNTRIASDGGQGIDLFRQLRPDLVLLDIMLPEEDGLSVLKKLRGSALWRELPVVMLTAKNAEYDRVVGLDAGADDYISKPFGMMELLARINAVLRRTEIPEDTKKRLVFDKLIIDLDSYELIVDGKKIMDDYWTGEQPRRCSPH